MSTGIPNGPKVVCKVLDYLSHSSYSEPSPPSGHVVGQLHLVMQPLGKTGQKWSWTDCFITYVQRFDFINKDTTQLHILKRTKRATGQRLGNVIPLSQVQAFAHLIPCFGPTADTRLTVYNLFEHSSEFYLNKYFDKTCTSH